MTERVHCIGKKRKMQQVSFEQNEENHFLSALIPFCGRLQQLFCLARWSFLHLFCANFKESVFYCPSTWFFVRSHAILRSSISCTSSRNTCEAISHVCSSTKPSKSTCDVRKYWGVQLCKCVIICTCGGSARDNVNVMRCSCEFPQCGAVLQLW